MPTQQLNFFPPEALKPLPPPPLPKSLTTEPLTETFQPPSEVPVAVESKPRASRQDSSGFRRLHTWGVKDSSGAWLHVTDHPWAPPHAAKDITRTEALDVFSRYPNAFQLIDGCDWWACLSDEEEVLTVVKEKADVPASEAIPGTADT